MSPQESAQAALTKTLPRHPLLVMSGLYLGVFTGLYSETSLNIALPSLSTAFGLELGLIQWLVVGYMLIIGIVLPFSSLLMKRYPVKKLVLFAQAAFIIGAVISAGAPDFWLVLAGRMIQGIGTGLMLPILFVVSMRVFPPQKLGMAMSVASVIIMVAPIVGPTLAGFLVEAVSWRAIFWSFVIIMVCAWLCSAFFLLSPLELQQTPLDLWSCVLSVIGFGGLVLCASLAAEFGLGSVKVLAAGIIGIIAVAIYVRRQLQLEKPVLDLRVFGYAQFTYGVLLVMLSFGTILCAMYVFPQYLQHSLGVAVAVTGLLLLPGGITNAIFAFLSGLLCDRKGAKILVRTGFIIALLAILVMIAAAANHSVWGMVLAHVLLAIGLPFGMTPAQTNALNSLPHHLAADGSTVVNTLQQVCGAILTAVTTLVLVAGQQSSTKAGAELPAAFTTGTLWSLGFIVCLLVIGLVLAFRVQNVTVAKHPAVDEQLAEVPVH